MWYFYSTLIIFPAVLFQGFLQTNIKVDPATLPTFQTSSQVFKVTDKDTVVLPCEVSNPGPYVLVWKKGIAVLSAGNVKVSPDPRINLLLPGYSLEIKEAGPQDAGDYVCQIGTLEPREITHTVEILVPPRIHYVSSNGRVEVKKGSSVRLECKASGNPVPKITWSRKNNLLPDGVQTAVTPVLTLERVDRHQAGVYQCMASNGVGDGVTEQIVLHVLLVQLSEMSIRSIGHTTKNRDLDQMLPRFVVPKDQTVTIETSPEEWNLVGRYDVEEESGTLIPFQSDAVGLFQDHFD